MGVVVGEMTQLTLFVLVRSSVLCLDAGNILGVRVGYHPEGRCMNASCCHGFVWPPRNRAGRVKDSVCDVGKGS